MLLRILWIGLAAVFFFGGLFSLNSPSGGASFAFGVLMILLGPVTSIPTLLAKRGRQVVASGNAQDLKKAVQAQFKGNGWTSESGLGDVNMRRRQLMSSHKGSEPVLSVSFAKTTGSQYRVSIWMSEWRWGINPPKGTPFMAPGAISVLMKINSLAKAIGDAPTSAATAMSPAAAIGAKLKSGSGAAAPQSPLAAAKQQLQTPKSSKAQQPAAIATVLSTSAVSPHLSVPQTSASQHVPTVSPTAQTMVSPEQTASARFCGNCGIKLDAGEVFCGECGERVDDVDAMPTAVMVGTAPNVDYTSSQGGSYAVGQGSLPIGGSSAGTPVIGSPALSGSVKGFGAMESNAGSPGQSIIATLNKHKIPAVVAASVLALAIIIVPVSMSLASPGGTSQTNLQSDGYAAQPSKQQLPNANTSANSNSNTNPKNSSSNNSGSQGNQVEAKPPPKLDISEIEQIIRNSGAPGNQSVAIVDIRADEIYLTGNATTAFPASAMISIPILYTVDQEIKAGRMSLGDKVNFHYSTSGRGVLKPEQNGQLMTIESLISYMLQQSDNNAMNTLMEYLSFNTINSVCQDNGYVSVNFQRLITMDETPLDNYVSARDLAQMMRDLYLQTSSSSSLRRIDQNLIQDYLNIADDLRHRGLGKGLPSSVNLYNLNGFTADRFNEIMIVDQRSLYGDPKDAPCYIVVFLSHGGNWETSADLASSVSANVYNRLFATGVR
jgi:beta-lactamase class A